MRKFIDSIMIRKTLKRLMATIQGMKVEWSSLQSQGDSGDLELGLVGELQDSAEWPQRNASSDSNRHMVLNPSANDEEQQIELKDGLLDEKSPTSEVIRVPNEPPLTARYLEIVSYTNRHGEICSALALTKKLVWEINTVLRCEPLIAEYVERSNFLESEIQEMDDIITQLTSQLGNLTADQHSAQDLANLQEANEIFELLWQQKQEIEEKLLQTREELERPRQMMYRDLKGILEKNNIFEVSDAEHVPWNKQPQPQPQPQIHSANRTPSETARYAAEDSREAALNLVREKQLRMQETEQILENWNTHYEIDYQQFCAWRASGTGKSSKTDFDIGLLRDRQAATRDVIRAEAELEDATAYARNLGVIFNEFDQESGFLDRSDDGYRESLEATLIAHVDRERIHNWLNQFEDTPEQPLIECDDWPSRSVKMCDSVSVVNEVKKERKRIDRWRSMCESLEVERNINAGM
jgi:hypothetical protein